MKKPLIIDYYSDILCVWAWVAQHRIDKLNEKFGDNIEIRYHYLDIFGDTVNKIPTQWREKGSYDGFSQHVVDSAAPYPDAIVNSKIWNDTRPTSSANTHLVLKAIELAFNKKVSIKFALAFREAFFIEAKDISQFDVLFSLINVAGMDVDLVQKALNNGSAMAALMHDYQEAKAQQLKGSPSYIIDNGRQVLYGNVGYRVLLANIEAQLTI